MVSKGETKLSNPPIKFVISMIHISINKSSFI